MSNDAACELLCSCPTEDRCMLEQCREQALTSSVSLFRMRQLICLVWIETEASPQESVGRDVQGDALEAGTLPALWEHGSGGPEQNISGDCMVCQTALGS